MNSICGKQSSLFYLLYIVLITISSVAEELKY